MRDWKIIFQQNFVFSGVDVGLCWCDGGYNHKMSLLGCAFQDVYLIYRPYMGYSIVLARGFLSIYYYIFKIRKLFKNLDVEVLIIAITFYFWYPLIQESCELMGALPSPEGVIHLTQMSLLGASAGHLWGSGIDAERSLAFGRGWWHATCRYCATCSPWGKNQLLCRCAMLHGSWLRSSMAYWLAYVLKKMALDPGYIDLEWSHWSMISPLGFCVPPVLDRGIHGRLVAQTMQPGGRIKENKFGTLSHQKDNFQESNQFSQNWIGSLARVIDSCFSASTAKTVPTAPGSSSANIWTESL